MVCCEICKEEMNNITWKHLAKHNVTVSEYKQQFPLSPMRSDESIARKRQSAIQANRHRVGIPRSQETIDKIKKSKANQKQPAWNKGLKMSQEQKDHLSQTKKDQYATGKIKHWNIGHHWSQDVKTKIKNTALSQHRKFSDISKQKRIQTISQKLANGWIYKSTERLLNKLSIDNQHKFNDKEWLYEQHITNKRTISSICVELGLHWKNSNKTVRMQLERFNIPIHYWNQTSSNQQREVEEFIKRLGFDIIVRNRTIIKPLELDIYIPEKQLAIEYCGLYWHTSEYKEPDYHKNKTDLCEEQGIRLITIFSDEWINNRTLVESKLKNLLGVSTDNRVYARNCTYSNVSTTDKIIFFNAYHIQGNGPSSINLGLYKDGQLLACMGFIKNVNDSYVLNRYATSCSVVGGFSKLLKIFVNQYHPNNIITFADRRWSNGLLYYKNGFTLDKIIPADYEYVDGELRIHKFNFRHNRLRTKLQHYDPSKTEIENTENAGIHRIYDCGKMRFILNCY